MTDPAVKRMTISERVSVVSAVADKRLVERELLREILRTLQSIDRTLRRRADVAPALVAALADFFGDGRFTVRGLLDIADEDPQSEIAQALADVVDMSAAPRARATQLGMLLSRLPDVEVVAQQRGGCAVYRCRVNSS